MKIRLIIPKVVVCCAYLALLIFQINNLVINSQYTTFLQYDAMKKMYVELIVFFLSMVGINYAIKGKKKILFGGALLVGLAYLHQTIFPLIGAAIYLLLIVMTGAFLTSAICKNIKMNIIVYIVASLIAGLNSVILIVACLSALHMYSRKRVWLLLCMGALFYIFYKNKKRYEIHIEQLVNRYIWFDVFLAICETTVLLQIGRVGLQGDYDALWYGIRSTATLANTSAGIYEDLGLVGFVYLYPKGFETILLPLCRLKSWNYRLLFNELLVLVVVWICWMMIKELADEKAACIITTVIATLPCMLNMAMTVKPDVITVLYQMATFIIIYYAKKEKNMDIVYLAIACIIASYSFKVTSLLFSSVLIIGLISFVDWKRFKIKWNGIVYSGLGICTLCAIWGRTYVLTGSPLIVYMGKILDLLGKQTKYPYDVIRGFYGSSVGTMDLLIKIVRYFYAYFVLPITEEFGHVIIAWGTSISIVLAFIAVVVFVINKEKLRRNGHWIWLMFVLFVALIFGIASVGQADGNYFLMIYIIYIVICGSYIYKHSRVVVPICYMAFVFNLFFVGLWNWSSSIGFTEWKWKNKGYISRQAQHKKAYISINGKKIYNIVNGDRTKKMIALTYDMGTLVSMNCISEYWMDIERSNPNLFYSAETFEKYLTTCGFDYIFLHVADMPVQEYHETFLQQLVQDGYIKELIFEKDNILFVLGENEDKKMQSDMLDKLNEYVADVRARIYYSNLIDKQ